MMLQVLRITRWEEFNGLASVWADIAAQSGRTTPFLSHDWFSCCWQAVGDGDRPEVLVLSDAGGPVALVPMLHRSTHLRHLPVRRLTLLDCPDSPYLDILAAGDVRPVVTTLLAHLGTRSDWDVFQLQRLPASSPTVKALVVEVDGCLPWRQVSTLPSPYLTIAGSWEAFYGAKSQRFKKTARNIQNRLERLGSITVEEYRRVAANSDVFAEMIGLTARSWKADRGVAIATMPRMREFFRALTECASARGWLSLWFLKLEGRPIAMEYQLQVEGVVHALRADYDLTHAAASPGSALNFAIARALFQRGGVHEYNMGPGRNEYKMRWATGCHDTVDLEIYRRSLYPRLLHALETVAVPAARRMRERFQ